MVCEWFCGRFNPNPNMPTFIHERELGVSARAGRGTGRENASEKFDIVSRIVNFVSTLICLAQHRGRTRSLPILLQGLRRAGICRIYASGPNGCMADAQEAPILRAYAQIPDSRGPWLPPRIRSWSTYRRGRREIRAGAARRVDADAHGTATAPTPPPPRVIWILGLQATGLCKKVEHVRERNDTRQPSRHVLTRKASGWHRIACGRSVWRPVGRRPNGRRSRGRKARSRRG